MDAELVAMVASHDWDDERVTDIWAPIEAIGTAGGFLIAAVVYAASYLAGRRAQAEQVSAWLVTRDGGWTLLIKNGSEQPIYYVTARAGALEAETYVLPPGEIYEVFDPEDEAGLAAYSDMFGPIDHLQFTDASGRDWLRDEGGGRLHRQRRLSRFRRRVP